MSLSELERAVGGASTPPPPPTEDVEVSLESLGQWQLAWRRFKLHRLAMIGLGIFGFMILLAILFGAYVWCRWGAGQWGFSPLVQLGRTSLLVYWVHIEFVYGRLSILKKHGMSVPGASIGFCVIFLSMLLLSFLRTRLKGRAGRGRGSGGRVKARVPAWRRRSTAFWTMPCTRGWTPSRTSSSGPSSG